MAEQENRTGRRGALFSDQKIALPPGVSHKKKNEFPKKNEGVELKDPKINQKGYLGSLSVGLTTRSLRPGVLLGWEFRQKEDLGERSPKTQTRGPSEARKGGKIAFLENLPGAAPRTPLSPPFLLPSSLLSLLPPPSTELLHISNANGRSPIAKHEQVSLWEFEVPLYYGPSEAHNLGSLSSTPSFFFESSFFFYGRPQAGGPFFLIRKKCTSASRTIFMLCHIKKTNGSIA